MMTMVPAPPLSRTFVPVDWRRSSTFSLSRMSSRRMGTASFGGARRYPTPSLSRRHKTVPCGMLRPGVSTMDAFLAAAIDEAKKGLAEGGIPIGSVLVIDGKIVGRGHNRRVQKNSSILHAEMDALENAGRLKAK